MKLPAFQFYPGDWRKDPGVQSLNFHDRGVWFEILCLLHESSDRGRLLLNGLAMPDDALARLLGLDKQVLTNTLTTLATYGVSTRCPDSGALMNRRMVRDEEIRKIKAACGKMGGNPALLKQQDNHLVKQPPTTGVKQNPTPSVAASTSDAERESVETVPDWQKSLLAAIGACAMAGVPQEFTERVWLQHDGTTWRDSQGRPITNWPSYVAGRYKTDESYRKERNANHGSSFGTGKAGQGGFGSKTPPPTGEKW